MLAKARLIQEQSSNDTHHSEANDLKQKSEARYEIYEIYEIRQIRQIRYGD